MWQLNPYAIPLFLTTFALLAYIAAVLIRWPWRSAPLSHRFFVLVMGAIAFWTGGYAFELVRTDIGALLFFTRVSYLGIASLGPLWLLFMLAYTGRERLLRPPLLIGLSIVPVLTYIFHWTTGIHGLLYRDFVVLNIGGFAVGQPTYGPWFWVHAVHTWGCILAATLVMITSVVRSPDVYRGQIILLLAASVLPVSANAIYLADLVPLNGYDITPFAFALATLLVGMSLYRYQLLDLAPAALDRVLASMVDAVFVIDRGGR
ncbi:MAG: hypothetical protein GYB64_11580, partial [Chloroflexi bacterium]|nr:hypothetical protein [Chloroflexota bacterium]